MKRFFLVLLVFLAILTFSKPKMAIYGFFSETFSREEVVSLNSILESAFVDLGYFTILDRARIDVILKERGLEDIGLVGSKEDALKVGKLVGADYVVYGTVERAFKTRGMVTLSVKIVDIATGEIVFSDSRTVLDSSVEEGIKSIVESIVYKDGKISKLKEKIENVPRGDRSKGWFSIGITLLTVQTHDYYGYYTEEYLPLPWLKFGSFERDTIYGANIYLGFVFRRYFGMFYFEAGTLLILLPYLELGLSIGNLDLGYTFTISADELGNIYFPGGPSVHLSFKF